mmetsp:Transcript_12760/g.43203  ORF Transcript_12760/g.43203 Transcript_12760/m.43203 type:complete len:202 (-) Transcript_12760:461-1066(-)
MRARAMCGWLEPALTCSAVSPRWLPLSMAAPRSKSQSTTSSRPARAASRSAVSPDQSPASTSRALPASRRRKARSSGDPVRAVLTKSERKESGPEVVGAPPAGSPSALRRAPRSVRRRTASRWPLVTASRSALAPWSSTYAGSQPLSRRCRMASSLPDEAAVMSAVVLEGAHGRVTSTPAPSRSLSTCTSPRRAAASTGWV